MPKIIENLQEKITEEVKKQVREKGYSKLTIRSVAKALNIGTGTVYNYFSSKENMVASYMSLEWHETFNAMKEKTKDLEDPFKTIEIVFYELLNFSFANKELFSDPEALKSFGMVYMEKHKMLRKQIASLFEFSFAKKAKNKNEYLTEFLAEALLSWLMEGKPCLEFIDTIQPLFN